MLQLNAKPDFLPLNPAHDRRATKRLVEATAVQAFALPHDGRCNIAGFRQRNDDLASGRQIGLGFHEKAGRRQIVDQNLRSFAGNRASGYLEIQAKSR